MSIIETITDVSNAFLSRRELTCNFAGLGGKLKSLEAADMITKEFKLDGKVVIPMRLKTQVGKSLITGTFYIYEDEALAKKHINPTIFSRIEKTKAKLAEAETAAKEAETAAKEAETAAKEAEAPPAEAAKEAEAVEAPAEETKKEEKTE
jgi:ribosomal protein S24E